MTRRSSRALARRFALALSVLLIGSTLALPAVAESGNSFGIISPVEEAVFGSDATIELRAAAKAGFSGTPQWALRQGSSAAGQGNTFTRKGNVDTFNTDLEKDSTTGEFFIEVDIPTLDLKFDDFAVGTTAYGGTDFFFVFNTGGSNRDVVAFTIDPAFDGFTDGEIETCADNGNCTITAKNDVTDQTVTASTAFSSKDGGSAFLGLRIATGDDVAKAVSAACDTAVTQVNPVARLGPDVVQLVPINFAAGSITVQSTIPRSFVNSTTPRGAGIFQVCVAAETADYAGFELDEIADTELFGPVILDDCDENSTAADACVLDKSKNRGDVVLTYQLPTEDPWLK